MSTLFQIFLYFCDLDIDCGKCIVNMDVVNRMTFLRM